MNPETVRDLVTRIERKDLSTAAHTWRVVLYTRALMEAIDPDDEHIRLGVHGAALHDVGKLEIPDEILQKPDRLTDEEFEIIKIHPVTGYARMIGLGVEDEPILDLIRYHHERWDGQGYPYGLAGRDIPRGARLFSVIDAFDAMTTVRPYRDAMGEEALSFALGELTDGSGSRYDPEAVDAFVSLIRSGSLDFIRAHFNDRVPVPAYDAGGVHEIRGDDG